MKNLFLCSFVAAISLIPMLTRAELLVYKGAERETLIGENFSGSINAKEIVIIDHNTGNFARIAYATINGVKRLNTAQYTNAHIVQVVGPNSKTYSIISRIPTSCEAQELPGREGVYFKGTDASLNVGGGSTTTFPRILNDVGNSLSYSSSSGQPRLIGFSVVLVFSQNETTTSNTAGETLDTAQARLVAYVQSLGYSQ